MRRLGRRGLVLLALLSLAAATSGDVPSFAERFHDDAVLGTRVPVTTPTSLAAPATTTTTEPAPLEWTLYAGGDVLMDRSEAAARDPFAHLVPALSDADIAVVNVEMSVADVGTPESGKEFTFQAKPSAAATMAGAGIDVASLGNNHSLDFGRDGLLATIANLRDAGIEPVGAGATVAEAYRPAVFRLGGRGGEREISVAVFGASAVIPAGWEVGAQAGLGTTRGQRLLEAVRAAASSHDVVITFVHWGVERAPCPNAAQVAVGDALVSAGADAVIGAHPHVLQPIVERGGGVVAYSLGNFVWHPRPSPQGDTGVLELRFVDDTLDGHSFHPHVLDAAGDPEPAGVEATERIETAVSDRCELAPG